MDTTKAPDNGVLNTTEVEAAKRIAREEVLAEKKAEAKKALVAQFKQEEIERLNPDEAMRTITLDLAPHQETISLDGTIYFHGSTYTVPKSVFDVMLEVQSRGWDHEESLHESENVGRRQRRPKLSLDNVNASANQLLRA